MTLITTLLAFIVALGSLVTLHELGHYLVARLCGVKVLRFSVGMGKVVYSRKFGKDQTEWAISALPLGGYVKMLDSRDPDTGVLAEADLAREFTRQRVWRRMAIIAAGPLANFLVAIVLYAGLFMHGIEEPSSKLGPVAEQTAAYAAGLRSGDTVETVNGKAVASWSELRWELIQATLDKQPARIEVRRPDRGQQEATLPTASRWNSPWSIAVAVSRQPICVSTASRWRLFAPALRRHATMPLAVSVAVTVVVRSAS